MGVLMIPWSTSLLPLYPLACPGGPSSPCSDHGVCLDGMSGSGQCQCRSGFAGTACELCAPGAFGLHCQGRPSLPCPTPSGQCANLYLPACPSPQPAAAVPMVTVMTALEALAPVSVMKAGLGHTVRCSWVSGPCAYAAHLHTPWVHVPTTHSGTSTEVGWEGGDQLLTCSCGMGDRAAVCVHPTLCTPGHVSCGQQL
jgi:hypothetical protein